MNGLIYKVQNFMPNGFIVSAARFVLLLALAAVMAGCAEAPAAGSGTATNEHAAEGWVIKAEKALVGGDLATAAKDYVKAADISSDPELAQRATVLAYHGDDIQLAAHAAQRWHTLAPKAAEPHHFLALLALKRHDVDKAAAEIETLMASGKRYTFNVVGGMLAVETSAYEGFEVMQRIARRHPDDPEAQYALAWLAARADHTALAQRQLDKALTAKPHWLKALMLRGRLLAAAGKADAALAPVKALLDAQPQNVNLKINYSELLFSTNRGAAARKLLDEVLAKDPENAEALLLLGADALDRSDNAKATRYLTRLLETADRNAQAYYYLGELAARKKDYRMALNWFQRIDHEQRGADNELAIAAAIEHVRDLATARKYLAMARMRHPQLSTELLIGEARLLSDNHDDSGAMKFLDAQVAADPDNTELLYARGMLAEQIGQHDKAIKDLRHIVQLQPENTAALNALGYVLTEHTHDYRQARRYIAKALDFAPDNAAIIDSLGWVDFRLGDTGAALKALRHAHDLADDPEISAHLIAVLRATGAHDEAHRVLEQALQKHPHAAVLKQLKPAS